MVGKHCVMVTCSVTFLSEREVERRGFAFVTCTVMTDLLLLTFLSALLWISMDLFHSDNVWEALLNPGRRMWTGHTPLDQTAHFKGIFLCI